LLEDLEERAAELKTANAGNSRKVSELNADLQDALESLEGALSGHADSSTVP